MNKTTTCIALVLLCLISSCTEKLMCPAYQSVFILDDNYRERYFSPFEVMGADTVPKGKFDVQRHRSDFFLAKAWSQPDRPVLENPYLMARIFKKRPYWKLDLIKPELIHYVNRDTVDLSFDFSGDSTQTDSLQLEQPIQSVLTLPLRLPPYNVDQIEYNKKFGYLFPRPPKPLDSLSLAELASDSLAAESPRERKGLFGIFKKKNKSPKPKSQEVGKTNQEGTKEDKDK